MHTELIVAHSVAVRERKGKKEATNYVVSWSCSKWAEGDENDDEEKTKKEEVAILVWGSAVRIKVAVAGCSL